MKKSVYDAIKKQNGEKFAKSIRRYDSGIFDIENLPEILRFAGRNAEPILPFLRGLKNVPLDENVNIDLNPIELLSVAGYEAFVADTLEKQNSILPYFHKGEELCTFNDETRYLNYHIIHAIKRGADKLNRDDFNGKEEREDEYGTSVISIQILKEGGFISIKNRYNHTVLGCDNTFNSNPDEIISGLSSSIKRYFNVDFSVHKEDLPIEFLNFQGRIYHYFKEEFNGYIGEGYFIKDGNVHLINPDYTVQMGDVYIDLKSHQVISPLVLYHPLQSVLSHEIEGEDLYVRKQGEERWLCTKNGKLLSVKNGELISLYLKKTETIPDKFLFNNKSIVEFSSLSTLMLLRETFNFCPALKNVYMPALKRIPSDAFFHTNALVRLNENEQDIVPINTLFLNKRKKSFLNQGIYSEEFVTFMNQVLMDLKGEIEVQKNGADVSILYKGNEMFHFENADITKINLLNADHDMQAGVIRGLKKLKEFRADFITCIGDDNFIECDCLEYVSLERLKLVGKFCFSYLKKLQKVHLPCLEKTHFMCFLHNPLLKEIELKSIKSAGNVCFAEGSFERVDFPLLKSVGYGFLSRVRNLKSIYLPKLSYCYERSFTSLPAVEEVYLPSLEIVGDKCFSNNPNLKKVRMPKVTRINGGCFYAMDSSGVEFYFDSLKQVQKEYFSLFRGAKTFFAPKVSLWACEKAEKEKSTFFKEMIWDMIYGDNQRIKD